MASLIDIAKDLGTEEQCLAYLENVRWGSGLACLSCGSDRVSRVVSMVKNRKTGAVSKKRYVYNCLEPMCKHQFTATTGTLFHDTHLPLPLWFHAIAIYCNAKKSVSAMQLQRDLGIKSYRTAWYLGHRIRKAMAEDMGIFGQAATPLRLTRPMSAARSTSAGSGRGGASPASSASSSAAPRRSPRASRRSPSRAGRARTCSAASCGPACQRTRALSARTRLRPTGYSASTAIATKPWST